MSIRFCINCYAAGEDVAQQQLDSLWSVWKNPKKSDTDRLKAIGEINVNKYIYSDPDSGFYFAQLQYNLADKNNNDKYRTYALNAMGVTYLIRSQYDSALIYYQKAIKIAEKSKNKLGVASILNNIGNIYREKGDYENALEYGFKSQKLCEAIGDKYRISGNLSNIGNIYEELGDFPSALKYYFRALKIAKLSKDKSVLSDVLDNIGNAYADMGNYENSTSYFQESLDLAKEINDKYRIGTSMVNLGCNYIFLKNYDTAYSILKNSISIMQETDDQYGIAAAYINLGVIYKEKNNPQKAIEFANMALTLAKDIESNLTIRDASKVLYEIYKETGDNKRALQMLELYTATNDSIINDNNHKALIRNQLQYSFDKKTEEIQRKNKIKDLKLIRRAYTIFALMVIAVLSFFIYYLIIKQNKLITGKKSIELEQKLLGSQLNTHFTFNAINSIQEFILNNQNDEAHYYLSEFSKLMRMVLTHNRTKTVAISDEIALLKKYILFEEQRIRDKIILEIDARDDIDLDNVKIPPMLLQPVIENSIWHGLRFQEGVKIIKLGFSIPEDKLLKIEVVDNGTGLREVVKAHSNTSHGISIIKERIRLLYNQPPGFESFEIKPNENGQGTTVSMTIPMVNEFE